MVLEDPLSAAESQSTSRNLSTLSRDERQIFAQNLYRKRTKREAKSTDQRLFCSSMKKVPKRLGELGHREKVVTCGNHEWALEDSENRKLISNARLLINQSIEVMGLKIWASPVTPLKGAAFGLSSELERAKLYSTIPEGIDVLITHGPPFGILDRAPRTEYHAGCRQLLAAVQRVKPRLHVFGHIHGAYGLFDTPETLFVNAALLGMNGGLDHEPVTLRMPRFPNQEE